MLIKLFLLRSPIPYCGKGRISNDKKTENTYGIYFFVVHTLGDEDIRHRQRLVQAVCLQFSTTSIIWKLLALWNSLPSVTLTVDVRPFNWWHKYNTMEALKFALHFVIPACRYFLYYLRHSILTCFVFTGLHLMHHIMHLCYTHRFHYVSLFSTMSQGTLDTAVLCTNPVKC